MYPNHLYAVVTLFGSCIDFLNTVLLDCIVFSCIVRIPHAHCKEHYWVISLLPADNDLMLQTNLLFL